MAEGAEMLVRLGNTGFEVGGQDADVAVHLGGVRIDRGNIASGQRVAHGGIHFRGQDRHTGHLQADQPVHALERAVAVVVGVHDEDIHVVQQRLLLESAGDLGKVEVADIGDDEADQRAALADQRARGQIERVAEFLGRGADAILGFRAKPAGAV
jgi:hypothetical protein